jgi:uncharacterized protein with beta-barrel porin domain
MLRRAIIQLGLAATVAVGALALSATESQAQCSNFCGPPPTPSISSASANNAISSEFAAFDLGSRFLQTIDNHALSSFGGGYTVPNAEGGGAGGDSPHYRSWAESYGLYSSTSAQGSFVGDTRRTVGGVAGLGANVVPGGWIGISIDQSHTSIDAPAAMQSAIFDLTQVGLSGSYEFGAWTISSGVIRGFGSVGTTRDTIGGPAGSSFGADLWGATTELNYYWGLGSARIVPKIGADWLSAHTAAYSESGPVLEAVSVPETTATRTRTFAGAEIGNSWMIDKTMVDLSAYGRALDTVEQDEPTILVSSTSGLGSPTLLQGPLQGQYGVDAGAMATVRLTALSRVYLGFESHFRDGYQAYGGTLGGEIKW